MLPGPADDVVIDLPAAVVGRFLPMTDVIHSLTSNAAAVFAAGSLSITADSTMNNTFSFVGGTLTGPGTLTLNGLVNWSAGTLSGPGQTVVNGGLVISGNRPKGKFLDGRTLINTATTTWSSATDIVAENGAVFRNQAGATLDMETSGALISGPRGGVFENAGTLRTAPATMTTVIGVNFNNTGTVQLADGTLQVTGHNVVTSTGNIMSVTGGGTVDIADALKVTLAGAFSVSGVTRLDSASGLLAYGPEFRTNYLIVTAGYNNFLAAGYVAVRSLTVSGGVVTFANLASVDSAVVNGGTVVATGHMVAKSFMVGGGNLTLDGGTLTVFTPLTISQGGSLDGSGTIQGDVVNSGQINVGGEETTGVLSIAGNYIQMATGVLTLKIGGYTSGTDFDQVQVMGQATLDGTLTVNLINGFMPVTDDRFQVLTFGSGNSTFSDINGDGPLFDPVYDDGGLTLVKN